MVTLPLSFPVRVEVAVVRAGRVGSDRAIRLGVGDAGDGHRGHGHGHGAGQAEEQPRAAAPAAAGLSWCVVHRYVLSGGFGGHTDSRTLPARAEGLSDGKAYRRPT